MNLMIRVNAQPTVIYNEIHNKFEERVNKYDRYDVIMLALTVLMFELIKDVCKDLVKWMFKELMAFCKRGCNLDKDKPMWPLVTHQQKFQQDMANEAQKILNNRDGVRNRPNNAYPEIAPIDTMLAARTCASIGCPSRATETGELCTMHFNQAIQEFCSINKQRLNPQQQVTKVYMPMLLSPFRSDDDMPQSISEDSPLHELRTFITRFNLPIKTSGTGRTKKVIFSDIVAWYRQRMSWT